MPKDTKTLDKLYLEWSQFTKARTGRELVLINTLKAAPDIAMYQPDEFYKLYTKWFEETRRNGVWGIEPEYNGGDTPPV